MGGIRDSFEAWRRAPGPEALLTLLRSCEPTAYGIAWEVFRHRLESEEAAQGILLAVLEKVRDIRTPDQFRNALHGISINSALDLKKRRRRAASVAGKTSMWQPSETSEDMREAVARAVSLLPDDARAVLVEHYYLKRTPEAIAEEDGTSGVAIWKRVVKAKEQLKEILEKQGLAVAVPVAEGVLDKAEHALPERSLLSDAVMAKIKTVSILGGSGAASGTQTAAVQVRGLSVMVAAALIVVALGAGFFMAKLFVPAPSAAPSEDRSAALQKELEGLKRELTQALAEVTELKQHQRQSEQVRPLRETPTPVVIPPPMTPPATDRNQGTALAQLKALASVLQDFQSSDRDGDGAKNFWVRDVAGLHGLTDKEGKPLALISVDVARSDCRSAGSYVSVGRMEPSGGYWFVVIPNFSQPTSGIYDDGTGHNAERFALCAYPAQYGTSGKMTFIIDEQGGVHEKDTLGQPVTVFPGDPGKEGWKAVK